MSFLDSISRLLSNLDLSRIEQTNQTKNDAISADFHTLFVRYNQEVSNLTQEQIKTKAKNASEKYAGLKTKNSTTLGQIITEFLVNDPIFSLIRNDAFTTHVYLQQDQLFQSRIYHPVFFNVSLDASIRLKSLNWNESLLKLLKPVFKEYSDLFETSQKNNNHNLAKKFGLNHPSDIVHSYMLLIDFAINSEIRDLNEEDNTNILEEELLEAGMKIDSILEFISKSRKYVNFMPVDFCRTELYFIPTFSQVSVRTQMEAFLMGIFFAGCTSKVSLTIHKEISGGPKYFFQHDRNHEKKWLAKLLPLLNESPDHFSKLQRNAKQILSHIRKLEACDSTKRSSIALQCVVFTVHHEFAYLCTKEGVQKRPDKMHSIENLTVFKSGLFFPQEKKFANLTAEELDRALNYYAKFAKRHF